MALEFRPYPIPEQREEPNQGLQFLDRAAQMAQIFRTYQQQKQANELAKQQRAADLAKNVGDYGEDYISNYEAILRGGKPNMAQSMPAPTAAEPQMTMAPTAQPDPYAQYQSIQDPLGPLPGLGDTPMPAQATPQGAAQAPAGPKGAMDITPEYLAQIRQKKGAKGLKEFTDTQGFLTSQKQAESQMGNLAITNESKIRDDYTKASTNFKTVSENIGNIQSIANRPPTAAGDISLIFSYMKLNDPGSTVREGEYATAANAAGIPDRLRALYNRALTGEKLAPAQRADFIKTSGDLYQGWLDKQKQTDDAFRGIATRSRVNPENVLLPYGVPNFDREALARAPGVVSQEGGSSGGSNQKSPSFASVQDAEASGLPKGTIVMIGNRRAVIE